MALVFFIDALPYTYILNSKPKWAAQMQMSKLKPNIGYSSNLHWQLFGDAYPDDIGFFTDWIHMPEGSKSIRLISKLLIPLDSIGNTGVLVRKIFDRYIFGTSAFANIPFKYRNLFTLKREYLFFSSKTTYKLKNFKNYQLILQDEGSKSFEQCEAMLDDAIGKGYRNIFASFSFADTIGHLLCRTDEYNHQIDNYMERLLLAIQKYIRLNPSDQVLIVSDHGMSDVREEVDIKLENLFGKQSKNTYIAFKDSAIMRIFVKDDAVKVKIENYLRNSSYGHLLTNSEKKFYGVSNPIFGDIIFNLYDGYVFKDNWFGKSLKKQRKAYGMHGFWPESEDQLAVILSCNTDEELNKEYNYKEAYSLISKIMSGGE